MKNSDKKPNILFIMTDQQRYDCLGCNGNSIIKTPGIDKLARQSAEFSSFFVQAPVCVPSRQTFFTGRYPNSHKNRVNYTGMNPDVTLMQQHLKNNGYETGFVGKLHYFPPTRAYALSTGFDHGLLHDAGPMDKYSDYVKWLADTGVMQENDDYRECQKDSENPYIAMIPEELHETSWCGKKTREMLKKLADRSGPFFLFSSYWKPHSPFEVPKPWATMYDDADIVLPDKVSDDYMENLPEPLKKMASREGEKHHDINRNDLMWKYRAYYSSVSQIDHQVGLTLQTLDELGLTEDTIVIFCSDHGDMMYNHGMIDKNVFFDDAVHVPFMIRYPDKIAPGTYNELIESTDVMATLLDLCGIDLPSDNQGLSFAPLITQQADSYTPRKYIYAENIIPEVITDATRYFPYEKAKGIDGILNPDAKMIRTQKWKYNYYTEYEELYDLEKDPQETLNQAHEEAYLQVKQGLQSILTEHLKTTEESDQIAPAWFYVKDYDGNWHLWENE